MSIITCVKVRNGVAIVADDTLTLTNIYNEGPEKRVNTYSNARKLFHLRPFPISIAVCGGLDIERVPMPIMIDELEKLLVSKSDLWRVDINEFSIEDIVNKIKLYFYDYKLKKSNLYRFMEIIVSGYSSNSIFPEVWEIKMDNSTAIVNHLLYNKCGLCWRGETEAITRLIQGVSSNAREVVAEINKANNLQLSTVYSQQIINQTFDILENNLEIKLFDDLMPIEEAADLAYFLAETTFNFERFRHNPIKMVGRPSDVAIITQGNGFQWLKTRRL